MKAWVLAFVVLASVACDRGEKTATSTGSGPTIKLVDAGKDPKRVLRLSATKGQKQSIKMALDMGLTLDMGGSPITQQVPTITMPMDVTVTDTKPDGDTRYTFVLGEPSIASDASANPAVIEAMKGAMVGVAGLSGSATITSRGFAKDVDIKAPATASAQLQQMVDSLKQSISQIAAPLPEEAVGVGAVWETTTNLAQSGMKLKQVAKTQLTAIEGDRITMSITMTQSAPKQKITNQGMTADLESFTGTGNGTSLIDLHQIVPAKAVVNLKSDMRMNAGGQSVGMGITMGMTMTGE